ncbi:MAG: septum formation initiator family protein [Candidatus Omnitrophota bacterium]
MAKIRIKSKYLVIGGILLVIFLPGYLKFMQLAAKNMYMEHEIRRLERENVKLYKEKKRLQEDMNYVEKVARDSMGVTRKGEIPIKIER